MEASGTENSTECAQVDLTFGGFQDCRSRAHTAAFEADEPSEASKVSKAFDPHDESDKHGKGCKDSKRLKLTRIPRDWADAAGMTSGH